MGGGAGWVGRWVGWAGRWQKPSFETLHDAHTVANDTPVGHIASESKSRSPLPNWRPPCMGAIVPAMTLLQESQPVNI